MSKLCFTILSVLLLLPCHIMAEGHSPREASFLSQLNIYSLPPFERAIICIKYYEGWHTAKNYPFIGWGHKIQPGEKLTSDITHSQADSLLRSDLSKLCKLFEPYGEFYLLLAVLAYQVGPGKILGNNTTPESKLIKRIKEGNKDIEEEYLNYCHYNGKYVPSIYRRRETELQLFSHTQTYQTLQLF